MLDTGDPAGDAAIPRSTKRAAGAAAAAPRDDRRSAGAVDVGGGGGFGGGGSGGTVMSALPSILATNPNKIIRHSRVVGLRVLSAGEPESLAMASARNGSWASSLLTRLREWPDATTAQQRFQSSLAVSHLRKIFRVQEGYVFWRFAPCFF